MVNFQFVLLLQLFSVMLLKLLLQAEVGPSYPRVHVDFALTSPDPFIASSPTIDWKYHSAEEEIRSAMRRIVKIGLAFLI